MTGFSRHSFWLIALFTSWLIAGTTPLHAQLRIVTYNTNGSPDPGTGLEIVLQSIGEQSVNGVAKPIDVLLLQEQSLGSSGGPSPSTAAYLSRLNALYTGVTFGGESVTYSMGSISGINDTSQTLIYRNQTVLLDNELAFGDVGSSSTQQPRSTMQYSLRPVGYDNAPFYIYNSHFKAGDGSTDNARKNVEATAIRNRSDNVLGQGAHVVYAGDFNFYTAGEAGFQTLIAPGNGQAIDPLGLIDPTADGDPSDAGNWSQNADVAFSHTQSPCSSGCGSAGGSMDDRFDFQLVTGEFLDGDGLSVIPNSYRAFGNNGSVFNLPINHPNNTYDFGATTYSKSQILNSLATITDHIPVVVDYQVPSIMQAIAGAIPATLSLGQSFSLDVSVSNAAAVVAALGADELTYSLTTSGSVFGSFLNQVDYALGSANTHFVSFDTSTPGTKSGFITLASSSQQVQNSLIQIPISYTVLDGELPPEPGPEVIAAQWTFEDSVPSLSNVKSITGVVPEDGQGNASAYHDSASTDYSNPAGNGSLESFSSNNWSANDYYQFEISTEGYQDISLSFDHTSSNTGPKDFGIFYGTSDEGPFFDTGITYEVLPNGEIPPGGSVANPAWNMSTASDLYSYEFDLSSITALDDQAAIFLRLVNLSTLAAGASGGTVSGGGTSRLDNFTIYYHSMPELGLPGDFNDDGTVDAADYVVWRKTNSGDMNAYTLWYTNFGTSAAGSGGQTSNVPEPATLALLPLAICLLTIRRSKLAVWINKQP